MSSWVFWIALLCLVIGIVLLVIYCIEHFDKKKKTTKNQLLIAAGAALFIIGVGLMIYYFVSKGKSTKTLVSANAMMTGPPKMSALNRGPMYNTSGQGPMNYNGLPSGQGLMMSEYTPPQMMNMNSSVQSPMNSNYSGGSLSPRYNGNSGWM